jgi:RNA polymerase sigma factor (sigma-70 family)
MATMASDEVSDVYTSVHPRLWRSLLSYTCDPEIASDAEAEAFAQALRRGEHIDHLASWVWKASFRIAAGMLATHRAERDIAARVNADPVLDEPVVDFLAMLQVLPAQQRACVALRYTGGFSASEIADLLGTSAGTVRVQLHRAHQVLRASLRLGDDT